MKKLLQIMCALLISPLLSADEELLLNLKFIRNGEVEKEVALYGSLKNPNSSSIDEVFFVRINGSDALASSNTIGRLNHLRRYFSYDSLSGGITKLPASPVRCRMLADSVGLRLETLYLTFEEGVITNSEMKPVYEVARNCLFRPGMAPAGGQAKESARAAIEVLRTVDDYKTLLESAEK